MFTVVDTYPLNDCGDQVEANVDPSFTCLVWQKLEQQVREGIVSGGTGHGLRPYLSHRPGEGRVGAQEYFLADSQGRVP